MWIIWVDVDYNIHKKRKKRLLREAGSPSEKGAVSFVRKIG
jgi:hypothetical protein